MSTTPLVSLALLLAALLLVATGAYEIRKSNRIHRTVETLKASSLEFNLSGDKEMVLGVVMCIAAGACLLAICLLLR